MQHLFPSDGPFGLQARKHANKLANKDLKEAQNDTIKVAGGFSLN